MAVFVLDRSGKPLMPCSEKRARKLLAAGRARVHRVMPFVIRLVDRRVQGSALQPLRVKIDPGSKTTGLALVREAESIDVASGEVRRELFVLNLFDLVHRGRQISEALTGRRAFRRRRRGANLRYRAPRFLNRKKGQRELADERSTKWLAPSLRHRIETTLAWVRRLQRWAPVAALSQELVRFDMQTMENAEIAGIEYQQGTLAGYELREYLLEKFNRTCCYCDAKEVPLNIEHIHPKAQGGTNRVSNLAIACIPCNTKKAARSIETFLAKDPARLARIRAQLKRPLKDAAAVNATRWALFEALARGRCRVHQPEATGLQVEVGSGGLTKFNRTRLQIPKSHALDAACVGQVDAIHAWSRPTLQIKCTGRGSYQRTRLTQYGFARGYLMRTKSVKGFRTGDLVRASVTSGKKIGEYIGRVAVRATGSFNIQTIDAVVQGISHKYCRIVQRGDGYGYAWSIPCTRSLPSASTQLNTGKNNFPVSSHPLASRSALMSLRDSAPKGGYPPEL